MYKLIVSSIVLASLWVLALAAAQTSNPSFRAIKLSGESERITGVNCASAKSCVVATEVFGGAGHVYATDGQKITGTLLTGNSAMAEPLGNLGTISFSGFSKVGNRLIVHVDGAAASFVSATGDITKAASWSAVRLGTVSGGFGLNQQMGFGTKNDRWVHFTLSSIYESNDPPGPGALWTPLWSPVSPSVPSNFEALKRADPKLCDADPGVSILPHLTQPAYVAPDLAVLLYPAGARNQRGAALPGVCISTDGGKRFYHVGFKGLEGGIGPLGVTCLNANKCFAFGGLDYVDDSAFIYVTGDAQKGVNSTWTPVKLPALREATKFRSLSFAPDGVNGWAVGWSGSNETLLFQSTDGGGSWKDVTATIRALAPEVRLHTVYAFDAAHVWIGGEQNTLLTTGN
jgi:hypothetical protein